MLTKAAKLWAPPESVALHCNSILTGRDTTLLPWLDVLFPMTVTDTLYWYLFVGFLEGWLQPGRRLAWIPYIFTLPGC